MTEDERLAVRVKLEALVTEREGMVAFNQFRAGLGQGIGYSDDAFFPLSQRILALLDEQGKP
ncbi:MAG: hypothetical protein PHV11_09890 [Candidatus Bipolaricaulis sp.]|jgi:5-formyltetrahydrofolate cyclo-ligase|nr:hypothetical protein [Candidatus Bipolaricaulis sp.]